MKPLKNQWGSVKPYSRHNSTCPASDELCSCPKWLYVRKRGETDIRYALNTPSWAEALERATDKLNSLNPEIAKSREAEAKQEREQKTVYEAINLWLAVKVPLRLGLRRLHNSRVRCRSGKTWTRATLPRMKLSWDAVCRAISEWCRKCPWRGLGIGLAVLALAAVTIARYTTQLLTFARMLATVASLVESWNFPLLLSLLLVGTVVLWLLWRLPAALTKLRRSKMG